jgi:hypothetical protein
VTFFDSLSLKNDVNVPSKSIKQKNRKKIFLVVVLSVTDEKSRIRIRIRWSEARSADPDPNPYQNVRDPEDCIKPLSSRVNQNME